MRVATNIIIAGGLIAAAVVLKKLVRSRRGANVTPTDELGLGATDLPEPDLAAVATESGIANVDPVPLSQIAGEGIDLDRDIAAHQEIPELHERLPRQS
jgi:hypothetical protein